MRLRHPTRETPRAIRNLLAGAGENNFPASSRGLPGGDACRRSSLASLVAINDGCSLTFVRYSNLEYNTPYAVSRQDAKSRIFHEFLINFSIHTYLVVLFNFETSCDPKVFIALYH